MVYESRYRPAYTSEMYHHVMAARDDELMHYGVPGMKWGRRKAPTTSYGNARAAYKSAKKAYNKSFNNAYYKNHQTYSLSKKKRQASQARWEDAADKAVALGDAKRAYKQAKQERKQAIGAAKSAYKSAKKDYNKSFNKAYNYTSLHPISQNFGKRKVESERRWADAIDKADAMNAAKKAYKKTKADYRRG